MTELSRGLGFSLVHVLKSLLFGFLLCGLMPLSASSVPTYSLKPITASHPAFKKATKLLERHRSGQTKLTSREVNRLASRLVRLAARTSDKDLLAIARLLQAELYVATNQKKGARGAYRALAKSRHGLRNVARHALAALMESPAAKIEATSDLFKISPALPKYEKVYRSAVEVLEAGGKVQRAIKGLERALNGSIASRARARLTDKLIALYIASGQKKNARKLLFEQWWRKAHKEKGEKLYEQLSALGNAPSLVTQIAQVALNATRRNQRRSKKRFRLMKPRNKTEKRMLVWAKIVQGRFKSKNLPRELKRLEFLETKLKTPETRPYFLMGKSLVLRKLDKDLKAAQTFMGMANSYSSHHLASDAAVQAGFLFDRKGQRQKSRNASELALKLSSRGKIQRTALWQSGFTALLGRKYTDAEAHFTRLARAYGGERDTWGITFAEKGGYWSARAAELSNKKRLAKRRYEWVIARFPLGWYAALAEARLQAGFKFYPKAIPQSPQNSLYRLKIPKSRDLDMAVAYIRMGRMGEARLSLESLLTAGRLPSVGRLLLASLYHRVGEVERARKVLWRKGVIAASPARVDRKWYDDLFPVRYRRMLRTVAAKTKTPEALLAGLAYVESRFQPKARSGAGAVGITQLLPGTARSVGVHLLGMRRVTRRHLRNAKTNMTIGSRFLRELLEHYTGNSALALASYNAGVGAVHAWNRRKIGIQTDVFVERIPYRQARNYVRRVTMMARVYAALGHSQSGRVKVPLTIAKKYGPFFEEKRAAIKRRRAEAKAKRERRRNRRKKRKIARRRNRSR